MKGGCGPGRGLLSALCVGEVCGLDWKEGERAEWLWWMQVPGGVFFVEDLRFAQLCFSMAGNKGRNP